MKRGLILIPYANKEAYKTGVNLCSSNRLEVYLKNCCVACMSAKQNACQQADVALVTNIDIPNSYKTILEGNEIKIIKADFDDFNFGGNYMWALAFYKLCALKHVLLETNYDYYAYLDSDVYVQSDFENIWKECDSHIMMYDICHGLQVEHYRHFLDEIKNFTKNIGGGYNDITHYGGEFFAAKKEDAVMFMSECQQVYAQMTKADFKPTHGDEFIISLAAVKFNVKNAGAYIYRFWTGSFRLISTCYKYNPVTILHVPAEKEYGMLKLYNKYISKGKIPTKKNVYRLLHLNRRSLRTVVAQIALKLGK